MTSVGNDIPPRIAHWCDPWRSNLDDAQILQGNNVKKRERNREFKVGARIIVNGNAPGGYAARIGTVLEIVFDSRYGVSFDNQKIPTVYLDSHCLEALPPGEYRQCPSDSAKLAPRVIGRDSH